MMPRPFRKYQRDAFKVADKAFQGAQHIVSVLECQDYSSSWQSKYYSAIVAADGHGDRKCFRSALGSRYAGEAVKECVHAFIKEKMSCLEKPWILYFSEEEIKDLILKIVRTWREKVLIDLQGRPLEKDARYEKLMEYQKEALGKNKFKAYGTTLLVGVMTKTSYFLLQLGDGSICVEGADHNAVEASKQFEGLRREMYMNNIADVTESMSSSNAELAFRYHFVNAEGKAKLPKWIFVTTDGLFKMYDGEIEPSLELVETIADYYSKGMEQEVVEKIDKYINDLAAKVRGGTGTDDISYALICTKAGELKKR